MLMQTVFTGTRRLLRKPAFAAAGAFTLAIGIGAVVAGFSVLKGVVLDPLPYPDAERLVHLFRNQPPVNSGPVSPAGLRELMDDEMIDAQLAGYAFTSYTLSDASDAERVVGAEVSRGFFDALGLAPALGRNLAAADQRPDAPPAAVISHRLWQERYGGDTGVLGETIRLNGSVHTIVGVVNSGLGIPADADVWKAGRFESETATGNFILMFARLGPGTSAGQLRGWANRYAERWAAENPARHSGLSFRVEGFADWMTRGVRQLLWLVLAAVSLVLLIACANVANLMLTRTLARSREIATQAALGARQRHLSGSVFGEAMAIALLGLLGGLLLAYAGVHFLREEAITFMPRVDQIGIDAGVVAFAAAAALLTALLCGLLPAVFARRVNIADSLRTGSKGGTGGSQSWRKALVIGEMAMCMALVVAALLLVTTIQRLSHVDPGFDTGNLLSAQVVLAPSPEIETWDEYNAQQGRFMNAMRAEVATLPGVESFGVIDTLPVTGRNNWNGVIKVAGEEYPNGVGPTVEFRFVDYGYFETLGLPLLKGRTFTANESGPPRIVVNQAFVDEILHGDDALGRQVDTLAKGAEIIGVVGNALQWSLDRGADPEIYFLYGQVQAPYPTTLVMRTTGDPLALSGMLRDAVRRVDAGVPVFNIRSMEQIIARSYAHQDFIMRLLLAFGVAALVIAAVGLYAVLAFAVSQRTRDIGVQLALGASAKRVLHDTLREGVLLAVVGIAAGSGLALLAAKLLGSLVFGVTIYEPLVYGSAGAVLGMTALVASLLPAWRASRVEPMAALRYE